MRNTSLLALLLLLCFTASIAQEKNVPGHELGIRKATVPLVLDGVLDEDAWQQAAVAKDFFLNYPTDTDPAQFQTEARMTFDDQALYVGFVCYDDKTPNVVQSLRRDFDYNANDHVTLALGPYNDGINGFYFSISPEGVQLEGTIAAGGQESGSYNSTWDNKWYSRVTRHEDRWIAEIMIPFKSFRYKNGLDTWNVTFVRKDVKRNATSSWIATPIQYIPSAFAYSGSLKWQEPPPHQSLNVSLIPYVAGGLAADKTTDPVTRSNELQVGGDAKIGVTPSLNLDLTVNPDFSQVEVDRQVINLTRFEFQFPERRQFFLENSDLFDRAGWPTARPFFSRRVGLATDSAAGTVRKVPIEYGARLSGSLSSKWRLSMLYMKTKETLAIGLPEQSFTAAAIQRNFWRQSSIQISYIDKHSLGSNLGDSSKYFHPSMWEEKETAMGTTKILNDFNRTITVDLDLLKADNSWYASAYYSKSLDDFASGDNHTGGLFAQRTTRKWQYFLMQTWLQKNYNAEPGFVPSRGVYPGVNNSAAAVSYTIYPKSKTLVKIVPMADFNLSSIPRGVITDKFGGAGVRLAWLNTAEILVRYNYVYQEMTNTFNPINSDKYTNFQPGEIYTWSNVSMTYTSDQRKLFRYTLGVTPGQFYNGTNFNVNGELTYRYQPYGSVSLRFDYNDLKLPDNYGKEQLFVLSPRFDLTFTDKIFLTTFVQYNTLLDNINLNARLQWRYKPASDFFLVYTENYLPATLAGKNYSLVFKFTYWLNI
ncbi:MAG: carbohydrate binding family 9 domain-containing protein [Cyclobacteriaceae bacterium]|nr:carbohydrate binding family 9 domain-containing protein [Cyclobacteriaceae bacterium]